MKVLFLSPAEETWKLPVFHGEFDIPLMQSTCITNCLKTFVVTVANTVQLS